MAIADLSGVISYSMFDMSYEGSYLKAPEDYVEDEAVEFQDSDEDDVALAEKEALEMKHALAKIGGWHFRKDEDWKRDTLMKLVSCKL